MLDQVQRLLDDVDRYLATLRGVDNERGALQRKRDAYVIEATHAFYSLLTLAYYMDRHGTPVNIKIPLIKLYRQIHECDLKEAKDTVEDMLWN